MYAYTTGGVTGAKGLAFQAFQAVHALRSEGSGAIPPDSHLRPVTYAPAVAAVSSFTAPPLPGLPRACLGPAPAL